MVDLPLPSQPSRTMTSNALSWLLNCGSDSPSMAESNSAMSANRAVMEYWIIRLRQFASRPSASVCQVPGWAASTGRPVAAYAPVIRAAPGGVSGPRASITARSAAVDASHPSVCASDVCPAQEPPRDMHLPAPAAQFLTDSIPHGIGDVRRRFKVGKPWIGRGGASAARPARRTNRGQPAVADPRLSDEE